MGGLRLYSGMPAKAECCMNLYKEQAKIAIGFKLCRGEYMQIRESIHHQINTLDIEQLLVAQEFLMALGSKPIEGVSVVSSQPYTEVRKVLAGLRNSLSEDILHNRSDRL